MEMPITHTMQYYLMPIRDYSKVKYFIIYVSIMHIILDTVWLCWIL